MRLTTLLSFSILLTSVSCSTDSNVEERHQQEPLQLPPSRSRVPSFPVGAGMRFRQKRQSSSLSLSDLQDSIVSLSRTDPLAAARMVSELPNTSGYRGLESNSGSNIISPVSPDERQYDWNNSTFFNPNGQTESTADGEGWLRLPQVEGLTLNRSMVITGEAIQPFYITGGYNAKEIKRAVVVFPGKPRDSWKYTNLIGNALRVATNGNHSDITDQGVKTSEILVLGPAWLNNFDREAGASLSNELIFHGSQWQSGGTSRSPELPSSITTYDVMDHFLDWLFDQTQFPNLNQVVIAGHSMGASATQKYALLKKSKPYDDNVRFWVGNPGSYAWLTSTRPYRNETCTEFDDWSYGIGGDSSNITKYARADVRSDKQAVVDRYRSRKVHYTLGLLDNGPGDTHCQAGTQGANHLDRGAEFIKQLGDMEGGFPSTHTADFVAGVSHQDFPMLSANISLQRLFADEYNVRHSDLTTNLSGGASSSSSPTSESGNGAIGLKTSLIGVVMTVVVSLALTL